MSVPDTLISVAVKSFLRSRSFVCAPFVDALDKLLHKNGNMLLSHKSGYLWQRWQCRSRLAHGSDCKKIVQLQTSVAFNEIVLHVRAACLNLQQTRLTPSRAGAGEKCPVSVLRLRLPRHGRARKQSQAALRSHSRKVVHAAVRRVAARHNQEHSIRTRQPLERQRTRRKASPLCRRCLRPEWLHVWSCAEAYACVLPVRRFDVVIFSRKISIKSCSTPMLLPHGVVAAGVMSCFAPSRNRGSRFIVCDHLSAARWCGGTERTLAFNNRGTNLRSST